MENNNPNEEHKEDLISGYVDEMRQIELEGHEAAVKKAHNALFLSALLIFLGEMLGMAQNGGGFNYIWVLIALAESGIFVALGFWTKKQPYNAVVGGLIAFIGIHLLGAVFNGIAEGTVGVLKVLGGGIIFKVVVLAALIRALKGAREIQQYKKQGPLG